MTLSQSLTMLLKSPTPEGLWQLRGDLLAAGVPADAAVWPLLDQAHQFFVQLQSRSSAREYSHFASLLDVGAIGVVVMQNLNEQESGEGFWGKIISGALSEGLMVLAARQYVRAWEEEMTAVYQEAAWNLYQHLWRISEQTQADLPAGERRALIDRLLQPLLARDTPGTAQAILIGRLYQLLLLAHVHKELAADERG